MAYFPRPIDMDSLNYCRNPSRFERDTRSPMDHRVCQRLIPPGQIPPFGEDSLFAYGTFRKKRCDADLDSLR
jgi:hypothetical protein